MNDDKLYDVPINCIYSDVIDACQEKVRAKFEPYILATLDLLEVHVLAALNLRIYRLARAANVLSRNGLHEEAKLQHRSCIEATVNLLYIMEVGQKVGDKSPGELAAKFGSYGDIAYSKMLNADKDRAKSAFMRRKGFSEQDFEEFLIDKERLRSESLDTHECTTSSWHELSFPDRAARVRDNRPDYVDETFAELVFSSFQSANSAVHGDALALRSYYNETGCSPLEFRSSIESTSADSTGQMVLWAWKCLARYYGEDKWMHDLLDKAVRKELRRRLEIEEEKSKRVVLVPDWIKVS